MNKHKRRRFNSELTRAYHTLHGAVLCGIEGKLIEIQAVARDKHFKPIVFCKATKIHGMARGAVKESLERIQGAFEKLGLGETSVDISINLAPADIVKDGTSLDLPIAIVMLQTAGYLPPNPLGDTYLMFGELGLNGDIRRVKGALALAFTAKPRQRIISPEGNRKESALVRWSEGGQDIYSYPVKTLEEVIDCLRGKKTLKSATEESIQFKSAFKAPIDFADIKGQELAKEAATVCAAGGHNMLMIGPPGEGKSLIASAMPGILPRLSHSEVAQLTRLYSVSGKLESDESIISRRPCRTITSTASVQALVGGGSGVIKAGEISLAHLGVLFMDEFPEFGRNALEALRAPMESGVIRISRVVASVELPARFTLIAAMNPCPCGYYGYDDCQCSDQEIQKYNAKISGPILDRIDIKVHLSRLTTDERFSTKKGKSSMLIRRIVESARQIQRNRFEGTDIPTNSAIPAGKILEYCHFSDPALDHYKKIIEQRKMSTRTMDRLAKVARTIADLNGAENIDIAHLDKTTHFLFGEGGDILDGPFF